MIFRLAIASFGFNSAAHGQNFIWTNPAGGSFSTPSNWDPNGPPTAGQSAVFNLPNAYVVKINSTANIGSLLVSAGSVTLDTSSRTLSLSNDLDVRSTAVIQGGTVSVGAYVFVGGFGTPANLSVVGGGQLLGGIMLIDASSAADATFTVSGLGSAAQFAGNISTYIGYTGGVDGLAKLEVSNFGSVGFMNGLNIAANAAVASRGMVNVTSGGGVFVTGPLTVAPAGFSTQDGSIFVSGAASQFQHSGGAFTLGSTGGSTGLVSVSSGGLFRVNDGGTIHRTGLIENNGGTVRLGGDVTFNANNPITGLVMYQGGANSVLRLSDNAQVLFTNGASAQVPSITLDAPGSILSFNGQNSALQNVGATLIGSPGQPAELTIGSTGASTLAGNVVIGGGPAAPAGRFNVGGSASVTLGGSLFIGSGGAAGGSGLLSIIGTNARLTMGQPANVNVGAASGSVGTIDLGSGGRLDLGSSTLTINPTGSVLLDAGELILGPQTIVNGGLLEQTAAGALPLASNGTISVSNGGTLFHAGHLTLPAGGRMFGASGASFTFGNGFTVLPTSQFIFSDSTVSATKFDIDGNGTIQLGSTVSLSSSLEIGSNGTLLVNGGSDISAERLLLGGPMSTSGHFTVDGTGTTAQFNASTLSYLGGSGSGTLVVSNGGSVDFAGGLIAADPDDAPGTMTINSGGKVRVSGALQVAPGSSNEKRGNVIIAGAGSELIHGEGSLFLGSTSTINGGGTISVSANARFESAGGGLIQKAGRIINTGGTVSLGGNMVFDAAVTGSAPAVPLYDGSGGTLRVLPGGEIILKNGALADAGGVTVTEAGASLAFENGASGLIAAGGVEVGAVGGATITFGGTEGSVISGPLIIGTTTPDAIGAVRVTNINTLVPQSAFQIGASGVAGSAGLLDISGGGAVQAQGPTVVIGAAAGSAGTVLIADNSVLASAGSIQINKTGVLNNNAGTLSALSHIRVNGGALLLGTGGNLNIFGAGSLLVTNGGSLSAAGALTVFSDTTFNAASGGLISAAGTLSVRGDSQLLVNNAAASAGTLEIGIALNPNSDGGTANFNSATFTGGTARVGGFGFPATLSITGGSNFTLSSSLFLNNLTAPATTTLAASTLEAASLQSTGTATINFLSGVIRLTGGSGNTLPVGGAGAALGSSVTLSPSHQLLTAGTLAIGGAGTVRLTGGTLSVGTMTVSPGGVFDHTSGTLAFTQSSPQIVSGGVLGQSLALTSGKALVVAPTHSMLVATGGGVDVAGGLLDAGGTLQLSTGARVTNTSPGGALSADSLSNAGVLELTGGVTHFGEVLPVSGEIALGAPGAALVVDSSFANGGLLRGTGTVHAGTFTNTASGRIRGGEDQTLRILSAAAPMNVGTIELFGGAVDFGSTALTNSARILGRGQLFAGSIDNLGTITLSVGASDIVAELLNTGAGKTIVTGGASATFYGPVANSGSSEFRVSAGSTAIFLDAVSGLDKFTGSGTTVFEGPATFGRIAKNGTTHVAADSTVLADAIIDGNLFIEGSTAIVPSGADAATSRVMTLSIEPGGRFDLADNALVIDYTGPSPLSNITSLVQQGYAAGAWTGDGINSSVAAITPNRAIGIVEASDIGSPAIFAGQPSDGTSVLLRYTLLGDADLNRTVNITDFALLAANFNTTSRWSRGDFNYDGITNISDFALLAANFNQTLPIGLPRANVPEPAVIAAVALLGMALTQRRRNDRA